MVAPLAALLSWATSSAAALANLVALAALRELCLELRVSIGRVYRKTKDQQFQLGKVNDDHCPDWMKTRLSQLSQ